MTKIVPMAQETHSNVTFLKCFTKTIMAAIRARQCYPRILAAFARALDFIEQQYHV